MASRKTLLDGDKLNMVPRKEVATGAMTVIDRLQLKDKEVQVVSSAATFLLLCERYGIDAAEAFRIAKRVMINTDERFRPEFEAVRSYLENEL